MVRWKDSSSTIWRSSARLDRRLPRARLRELARRLRPRLARRPPQVPAKGRDAAGGARLPRARRKRSETDDAVPPGRQYLGGPRRGRSRSPARPQGPLLLAGFFAARLRAQCRPRRFRAVLGEDRPPQAAGLHRALIDAELRRGGLPGEPARARAVA